MRPVWLASGSPRRRDLLRSAGVPVEVRPSDIDETRDPSDDPVAHAARLAVAKAAVGPADRIVLAADTVVHAGPRIFDKPASRSEAAEHLAALSGGWHGVTTGVCVAFDAERHCFTVTTEVRFRALLAADIRAYLATGEADDKAGAYAIQGRGCHLVAEVRGSYTNVIGLPVEESLAALAAVGVQPHAG